MSTEENSVKNKFYLPAFMDYFEEYMLPYFPLFSAIIIQEFGHFRESNAAIENYFRNLKNVEYLNKKNMLCPRFVRQNHSHI